MVWGNCYAGTHDRDVAIGLMGFTAVEVYKLPAPLTIRVGCTLGVAFWAARVKRVVG